MALFSAIQPLMLMSMRSPSCYRMLHTEV
jgi:hypothetical protein